MISFKNKIMFALVAMVTLFGAATPMAMAQDKDGVYFIEPKNGAKVPSTFTVKFGLKGKAIGPVGDMDQSKGHHHLIVNGKPVDITQAVPFDDQHKHFGKGDLQTELSLPAGKHTLTLQFGDGAHRSYGPAWTQTITVEVQDTAKTKVSAKTAELPPSAW